MPLALLAHSPADVVRQLLIDLALGTAAGTWPVYADGEPDSPDACITVYTTAGRDQGRVMVGNLLATYGIQVRVRAARYAEGWVKADSIRETLARSVYQETPRVDGTLYVVHAIVRIGQVLAIGRDVPKTGRELFTVNCEARLRPAA
jgi:hypothetical protein